ncbi:hypothetical protein HUJ04_001300 [Dendroctonus ponderosae]|nr:hypothetical protein HUJ04_001300 [Dendroctonus ponderosae]
MLSLIFCLGLNGDEYRPMMKFNLNIVCAFCVASIVKAAPLISTYNLISPYQLSAAQHYSSPSIDSVLQQYYAGLGSPESVSAHPAALATAIEESSIPNGLKKSEPFYGNPFIADALAKESLNFNKETVVFDRPSEQIDRREIAKLINSLKRVHHEAK